MNIVLAETFFERMLPKENSVIVNLHNWNGESCISDEAYDFAKILNITLLTMDAYYVFIRKNRKN